MLSKEVVSIGNTVNGLEILEKTEISNADYKHKIVCKVKCIKCGYIQNKTEYNLRRGKGCSCCSGRVVIKGINDVATTHPHLVKYFVNIEDAYTHTYASNKKCLMKCPDCEFEKWMIVANLFKQGFCCNICSDGFSYPNKFIAKFLTQSNVEFELEKRFNWAKDKIYDVYIPSMNCIIENNGIQHYEYQFNKKGRTIEEEQENDRIKKELALKNGIEYYIELDCRKSDMEWIKNSVISSGLLELLNIEEYDIEWLKCEEFANSSLMIECCRLWNSGEHKIVNIMKTLNICRATTIKFLKRGTKQGICDYDAISRRLRNY